MNCIERWPELAGRCPQCQAINDTGRICETCVDEVYRPRGLWCDLHGPTWPGGCDACCRERLLELAGAA